jgi:hypothetical protein
MMLSTTILFLCTFLLFEFGTIATRHVSTPAFVSNRNKKFGVRPTGLFLPTQHHSQDSCSKLFLKRPSNHTSAIVPTQKLSSTELSASFADVATIGFKVYCDLDGVLADFEKGVIDILGRSPSKIVKGTMWKTIARTNAFYENLDWTRDGQKLWNHIKHLNPDILTGVPYPKQHRIEKVNWCKKMLGIKQVHHVDMASGCRDHETVNGNEPVNQEGVTNVITCWSNNKARQCKYGSVLIDDREDFRASWEAEGGIFIHHTDTESTIVQLKERGIL